MVDPMLAIVKLIVTELPSVAGFGLAVTAPGTVRSGVALAVAAAKRKQSAKIGKLTGVRNFTLGLLHDTVSTLTMQGKIP